MLTLAIDTSTNILSIALVQGDEVLTNKDMATKNNQSEILMSKIAQMMSTCQLLPADLEKIAVAIGPGSYTGIRVGVTVAKSLAYALNLPLVAVSSLEIMASAENNHKDVIVPMMDARRQTVFAGAYQAGENIISDGHYTIGALIDELKEKCQPSDKIVFIGDGANACEELLLTTFQQVCVKNEQALTNSKSISLARLAKTYPVEEDIHQLVPKYLRQTEAEMNLNERNRQTT